MNKILEVNNLKTSFFTYAGEVKAVDGISFTIDAGEAIALVGESGCGKSVTAQAQILQLMKELREKINTSIILITHDLGVVAGLCQKVIVMYAGKIVEAASLKEIFYNPKHPYTWGLLKSIPRLNAEISAKLVPIYGQPPDLLKPPAGCRFAPRCDYAMRICETEAPPFFHVESGHQSACWLLDARAPKIP